MILTPAIIRFRFTARIAAAMLLSLGAAGCASTRPATEEHHVVVDADRDVYRQTEQGVPILFSAPRDSVWKALVGAYSDIGLLPDAADTSMWAVGRSKITMRGAYKGSRTSALFSCGETATGASQADVGQVIANMRSQITNAGASTRVSTLVDAWVIPDGGTSSNALHCGSTGILEAKLHKAVAARLGIPQFGS
jgi:hypothetical protein